MHKLALVKTFAFDGTKREWVQGSPCWREVYQYEGKWQFWCGQPGIISDVPNIIRMVDLPE